MLVIVIVAGEIKWLVDDVIWGGNVIYKTLFGGMLLSLCLCCLACMHL